MLRTLAVVPWLLAVAFALCAQTLEVVPNRAMVDETVVIRAAGLEPGGRIEIRGELVDGAGGRWESKAEFVADAQGIVDASKQAPAAGSYKGVSSMGLVWSMMPASGKEGRYQPPRNLAAQIIDFRLMSKSGRTATARLEQLALAEGVTRTTVRDGDLRGILFLPPGTNQHPGVLVLGGSEGGLPTRRAAWLASHGYAALALAYFRYEDLPQLLSAIPLEYFGRALAWMTKHPRIAPERIAVMGTSRGAELALQLGSIYKVAAVVAYAPSNVRNPACCGRTPAPYAWTWDGSGLAFRPVRGFDSVTSMRAEIAVETTQGPILLISGDADGVWPSSSMGNSIAARLKHQKFAYKVEHFRYRHAGHGAGWPEIVPAWQGVARNPMSGRETTAGGSKEGNAESSIDAIPKTLEFLRSALQP